MDHQNKQTQDQTTEQQQGQHQQQVPHGGQYGQPPHGVYPPHGQHYQQPYGQQPYPYPPVKPRQPAHGYAVASLVLGIVAMIFPIPVFCVIIGVLGLVFAIIAKKQGHQGGMSTAGLVLSILGTIWSAWLTITVFSGLFWWFNASSFFRHFM